MAPSKVCTACGIDVSRRPRTKDAQGRYFCEPCWAKAAATPPPALDSAPLSLEPAEDPVLAQILAAAPAAEQPAPAAAGPKACPACSAALSPAAAVCLTCGFNLKTGKVLQTRVVAAPRGREGPPKAAGERVTLGTNTDWPEVGRIASGIFLYFLVVFGFSLIHPLFGAIYLLSLAVLLLYFLIGMVVQPFLEGLYVWGLYHSLVLTLTIASAYYTYSEGEKEASIIPTLLQLPSIYYVFWKCTNDRLKAIWLLAIILTGIMIILIMVGSLAITARGG